MKNGNISFEDVNFISKKDFDFINKRSNVDSGDILFGMIGTIGNPVIVGENSDFAIKNVALIKELQVLKNSFLIHYLNSPIIEKQFHRINDGGTQKFIALGKIRNLIINIPTVNEQIKLSNFLENVDKKIELLETKHQAYLDFKKYLMQQIFTQKLRFNEYCEEIELGNIVNYQNSKALEKYFNDSNGYEVISIGNYTTDGNYIKNNVFISKDVDEVQKYVLNRNDLAMVLNDKTQKGNIIGRCILIDENDKYVYNQRTARLTPKIEVNPYYLHQLINSPTIHKKIFALSQGATQIYINKDDLLNIKLPIPNTEVQNEFGNLFSNVNKKIELSSLRVNQMILFKKSMLQQMFV